MKNLRFGLLLYLVIFNMQCSQSLALLLKPNKMSKIYPIQAHRGGGFELPENTIETLLTIWEKGIVPEVDLRTTADGTIILLHDRTVSRVAPHAPSKLKNTPVSALNYAELAELDVGEYRGKPGERIPKLEDVLSILHANPNYKLYLDLKRVKIDQLLALIKKYKVHKQVIITTSNYQTIQRVKLQSSRIRTMLWGIDREHLPLARQVRYRGINFLQVRYLLDEHGVPNFSDHELQQLLAELEKHHVVLQVLTWDIEDPAVYRHLYELGIKSIATDYPDLTLRVYREVFSE